MSHTRHHLTPTIQQAIVAYIRAGGFAHVAAEAAGIPKKVFDNWLRRGESHKASPRLRAFAHAVREAIAQARLAAELDVRTNKPLDWLRYGPGREHESRPGWTTAARARSAESTEQPPLAHPSVQTFIRGLLDLLESQPELRRAAVELLSAPSSK